MSTTAPRLHIDFHLDVVCPWCWIGLRHLWAALKMLRARHPDLDVPLRWHATPLLPHIPDEGVPFQAFYEARLGSRQAVNARRAQINAAARSAGLRIEFDAIGVFPNTRLPCALIDAAQAPLSTERMFALVESIYEAFFLQGHNIGQPEVLVPLARAAGLAWPPARDAAPAWPLAACPISCSTTSTQ
ncbi:MAG: DsbA family protein [Pseudomonadota bacterium]|nr:DsbA family protein [Pseudomonadota bacterium]